MEHSKFGAFMIQCNNCSRGSSISEEDFRKEIITCSDPECGSQFSIYEGIKNGLKKVEDHISPNFFLANEMYNLMIETKVGFTSYIDTTLALGYSKIGLDNDSISRLLEAGKMHDKVNPLMNNLFEVKLSTSPIWGNWNKKVLVWRNQIAHGTKISATKEEAFLAYETVIDSIFHLIEGVDLHLKKQGHTSGMFFRS